MAVGYVDAKPIFSPVLTQEQMMEQNAQLMAQLSGAQEEIKQLRARLQPDANTPETTDNFKVEAVGAKGTTKDDVTKPKDEDNAEPTPVKADMGDAGKDATESKPAVVEKGSLKDQGNAAFKVGNFAEAKDFYTQALHEMPTAPTLWSNRAQANLKLGHPELAFADIVNGIKFYNHGVAEAKADRRSTWLTGGVEQKLKRDDPLLYQKMMFRLACANFDMKAYGAAAHIFGQVLELGPLAAAQMKLVEARNLNVKSRMHPAQKKLAEMKAQQGLEGGTHALLRMRNWPRRAFDDASTRQAKLDRLDKVLQDRRMRGTLKSGYGLESTHGPHGVEVKFVKGKGLGLFATRKFKKFEPIFVERPVMACVLHPDHCMNCASELGARDVCKCKTCGAESYCSENCRTQAFWKYHYAQCGGVAKKIKGERDKVFGMFKDQMLKRGVHFAFSIMQMQATIDTERRGRKLSHSARGNTESGESAAMGDTEFLIDCMDRQSAKICSPAECFDTNHECYEQVLRNCGIDQNPAAVVDFDFEKYNSWSMVVQENQMQTEDPKVGALLLASGSFINHSCVPNVEVFPKHAVPPGGARPEALIYCDAREDIEVGDELTWSYPGLAFHKRSLKERKQALFEGWNFDCQCSKCKAQEPADWNLEKFVRSVCGEDLWMY